MGTHAVLILASAFSARLMNFVILKEDAAGHVLPLTPRCFTRAGITGAPLKRATRCARVACSLNVNQYVPA